MAVRTLGTLYSAGRFCFSFCKRGAKRLRGKCYILPGAYPSEDLSAEMLVSSLRRRLGSVALVLHRGCVVFWATEAAALTMMMMLFSLSNEIALDGQEHSHPGLQSRKGRRFDCFVDVVDVTCCRSIHVRHSM